ncbi:MAG: ABC transporter ATP-binding protein [Zetaproteobacteria bacterium]|jgi:branched-chain amino acid transport system ATP-binding protein|nr:MAG: ABC transporter ATP-binding protein [Zetaproteobacteria bacterium]
MSDLVVADLRVGYGAAMVLHGISLTVRAGEVVTIVGANGAGKTTLLKTVAGVLAPRGGRIALDGNEISGRPAYAVAREGVIMVPEGRGIFGDQTVRDNLMLGALARREATDAASTGRDLEQQLAFFPALRERLDTLAGGLSGGQQQMLALARGLMARPRVLLLDEPSLGLSPVLTRQIFDAIGRLKTAGLTILLVEQMAAQALALADRAYVLERGRIVLEGAAAEVRENPTVLQAYLGRTEHSKEAP